jgi:hypothetical protein
MSSNFPETPALDDLVAALPEPPLRDNPDNYPALAIDLIAHTDPNILHQATQGYVVHEDQASQSAVRSRAEAQDQSEHATTLSSQATAHAYQEATAADAAIVQDHITNVLHGDSTMAYAPTAADLEVLFAAPDSEHLPADSAAAAELASQALQKANAAASVAAEREGVAAEQARIAQLASVVERTQLRLARPVQTLGMIACGALGAVAPNVAMATLDAAEKLDGTAASIIAAGGAILSMGLATVPAFSDRTTASIARWRANRQLSRQARRNG